MNENYMPPPGGEQTTGGGGVWEIDPTRYEQFMRDVKLNQNLPLAILGGLIASLVAGILWALITYVSNYKIGFVAVGVGFLVGYAVRIFGKGITPVFGVVGAVFALFGCLFGDVLTTIIAASQVEGVPASALMNAFLSSPGIVFEILKETFSPMDLLFYAIAVYEGYKISLRQIGEDELSGLRKAPVSTVPPPPSSYPQP